MFNQVKPARGFGRLLWSYCFHEFLVFPGALILGWCLEPVTRGWYAGNRIIEGIGPAAAVVTAVGGFWCNSRKRDRSAVFVFLPPLFYFLNSWTELSKGWNPSWSRESHYDYVMNNLFGPSCGSTECLYTVATGSFLAGLFYSMGALLALKLPDRNVDKAA